MYENLCGNYVGGVELIFEREREREREKEKGREREREKEKGRETERERDIPYDTNVMNDDVFRSICRGYLRPMFVIDANLTHSPYNP
jgi:hypothetical protein